VQRDRHLPQQEQEEGEARPQFLEEEEARPQFLEEEEADQVQQGRVVAAEDPGQVPLVHHLLVVVAEGEQNRLEAVEALVLRRVVVVLGVRLHSWR